MEDDAEGVSAVREVEEGTFVDVLANGDGEVIGKAFFFCVEPNDPDWAHIMKVGDAWGARRGQHTVWHVNALRGYSED